MVQRQPSPTEPRALAEDGDWNSLNHQPSAEELRLEIKHYERKAAEARRSRNPEERWKYHLFRDHANHRRKLLAALRDGRPEAWMEYPD